MDKTIFSTRNHEQGWTFRDAVIQGLAPDGGLFMPSKIERFSPEFFKTLPHQSLADTSFEVAQRLVGDALPSKALREIVDRTVSFDVPLVKIDPNVWAMELFHGPTLAFKDFGARFLAGLMGYFAQGLQQEIVVLAATSGDTGSAVANGFYRVPGVRVVILYPSGKVSPLQEKQLTTLGENITAWEVSGTFDDCQRLVKQLFLDEQLRKRYLLTSANSINLGRLIPQTFYYFEAWKKLSVEGKRVVACVPSGNFGNLTAGILARRLGLPIDHFVAATNANDVVPQYLSKGLFQPRPSLATISNAMDVGDPSNFARLLELYHQDQGAMSADISGFAFSDEDTRAVMRSVYREKGYVLDPHGAVGYLGLRKYLAESGIDANGFFLETAHPGKFSEVVDETLGLTLPLPKVLEELRSKPKRSVPMSNRLEDARRWLTSPEW